MLSRRWSITRPPGFPQRRLKVPPEPDQGSPAAGSYDYYYYCYCYC